MTQPSVSLVVVSFGRTELVAAQLASLSTHPDREYLTDVVLVDNDFPHRGDLRSVIDAAAYPFTVRFAQHEGAAYGAGLNLGARMGGGEYVAVANADLLWPADQPVLGPLLTALEGDRAAGIAGPQQVYPDGRWQRSHGPYPSIAEALRRLVLVDVAQGLLNSRNVGRPRGPRPVDYVDGAFMLIRRTCFEALDGFDPHFDYYAEDVDLCWRARARGWRRLLVPTARLVHLRGAETSQADGVAFARRLHAAKVRFVRRHEGPVTAAVYDGLSRAASLAHAFLYSVFGLLRRTPGMRRRAQSARDAVRAFRRP